MSGFQYIGVVTLAALLVLTIILISTKKVGRISGLIWLMIWTCGIIALVQPDVTTLIANIVGIHRGADLLLYVVVIIMTIGFFSMYLRLRQLRREFTLLIRRISIMDMDSPEGERRSE